MIRKIKSLLPLRSFIVLAALLYLFILPIICWNLQYSSYFIEGDLNYAAYQKRVKNNDRLAASRSTLNQYFNLKNITPFNYINFKSERSNFDNKKLEAIGIIVIALNRDTRKIDAYQPKYLTQSMGSILEAINRDINVYGKRWVNISVLMCNVDDFPERFSEFNQMRSYFDSVSISKANYPLNNDGNVCKAKYQFLSCAEEAFKTLIHVSKFIFVEDDLLMKLNTIDGIYHALQSLNRRFQGEVSRKLGYVQLYYPLNKIKFSFFDFNSLLEILVFSSGILMLLLLGFFRIKFRPWFFWYNFILVILLFGLSVLCVLLIGRPHWRSAYHSLTQSFSLVDVLHPSAAAVMLDRQFLRKVGEVFNRFACVKKKDNSKLAFLQNVTEIDKLRVLSTNVNLFRHVGLYSNFRNSIINPHHVDD